VKFESFGILRAVLVGLHNGTNLLVFVVTFTYKYRP